MTNRLARAALPREFYDRDPAAVATALLGKILVRRCNRATVSGRIVETEAYLAESDAACHAARGRTRKNASMFGPPGRAYVYPIHARYCFNVVTEPAGVASAVLVRAVEPLAGIPLMQQRRMRDRLTELASGPAKLCQALDIDCGLDGWDMTLGRSFWIEADGDTDQNPFETGRSARIGVTSAHDLALRFYVKGSEFVSGSKRLR